MFGLFGKKDPVCGMKEVKGKGINNDNLWFCSENCLETYSDRKEKKRGGSCCH